LSLDHKCVNLHKYKLTDSYRFVDYPNLEDGYSLTNKSIIADLSSINNYKSKHIRLVYRKTFNDGSEINSRLYISGPDSLKLLNKKLNKKVENFMNAVDYIHDYKLVEKDTRKTILNKRYPDYLSMYV